MTTPFPRRLKLLVAINDAYARGDLEEAYRLEDLHLAELTGRADRSDALIDRIAAFETCERIARLDARIRQAPGPLLLDLSGRGQQLLTQQDRSDASWTDIERRIDSLVARIDGKGRKSRRKAKCTVGYSCGKICIPKSKSCRANGSPTAGKLQQLVQANPTVAAPKNKGGASKSGAAASDKQKTSAKQKSIEDLKKKYKEALVKARDLVEAGDYEQASKMSSRALEVSKLIDAHPDTIAAEKKRKAEEKALAIGQTKPPTKGQLAKQEAKVKKLQQKVRGKDGAKYVYLRDREAAKLADMKNHAADPEGWSKAQAEKAAAKAAQDAKEKKWKALQDKLDTRQAESGLTDGDKLAINQYTDSRDGNFKRSYASVNDCARNPPCEDDEVRQFTKELDQALSKIPSNSEKDGFFRGIAVKDEKTTRLFEALSEARPGTVLRDPGFGSYTSQEEIADRFMNNENEGKKPSRRIKIVNRSSELKPISKFSKYEREYEALLPRNVSCTVRKVTTSEDGLTLVVELE